MTIFDSHAHLIADDDVRYPPSPISGALRPGDLDERFPAEKLLALMDEAGVARICAVQRAHIYGYDPSYVIDSAARYPDRITAIVGVDAAANDGAAQTLHWMASPHVSGIRLAAPTLQTRDTHWLDSEAALRCWEAAAACGTPVCVHMFKPVREQVLTALVPIARRFPQTKIVIDHVAHAAWEDGPPGFGFDTPLARLMELPNIYLKFTTINLRRTLDSSQSTQAAIEDLASRVGAARLMWGSDIAQTKVDYIEMARLAKEAVASLPEPQQAQILTGTCAAFYEKT